MKIESLFPAIGGHYKKLLNKNLSWTKRGPGRRHNHLTAKEQAYKDMLMTKVGLNASESLEAIEERRGVVLV